MKLDMLKWISVKRRLPPIPRNPNALGWRSVALCGWLAVGVLLLLLVSKMNYSIQVELENIRLKRALELFTRAEGSCTVMNNGPRVICVMKEGQVSRRDMEYTEQIVWRPSRKQLERQQTARR